MVNDLTPERTSSSPSSRLGIGRFFLSVPSANSTKKELAACTFAFRVAFVLGWLG